MPTYEYKCDNCGHLFEFYQSMKDDKLTKCPECGKETLRRLIGTGSGLIFKGSGFYLTDYKNKPSDKSATSPSASSPDTKKTESTGSEKKVTTDKESKSSEKSTSSNTKSDSAGNTSSSKDSVSKPENK